VNEKGGIRHLLPKHFLGLLLLLYIINPILLFILLWVSYYSCSQRSRIYDCLPIFRWKL